MIFGQIRVMEDGRRPRGQSRGAVLPVHQVERRAVVNNSTLHEIFMRFTLVFPRIVHFNVFTEDIYFFLGLSGICRTVALVPPAAQAECSSRSAALLDCHAPTVDAKPCSRS